MSTAQEGNTVSIHYTGTLSDGTEFDSSRDREPISFELGAGQVIPGFNDSVLGMSVGETKSFTILSENAYGPRNEQAVQNVGKSSFPEDYEYVIGQQVHGTGNNGQPFLATITSVQDEDVTLDFNHPLAGKDLNFDVELVSITSGEE